MTRLLTKYPALSTWTTLDWFTTWSHDALTSLATSVVDQTTNMEAVTLQNVADCCATFHEMALTVATKMSTEIKRTIYVTAAQYMNFVHNYVSLLMTKRAEMEAARHKLTSGLSKIEETKEKVFEMTKELEVWKEKLAIMQKKSEESLVILVQKKREADEQQQKVSANKERMAVEEAECQLLAQQADHDLQDAIPELEDSIKALEALKKNDVTEIKSYAKPPPVIERVMEAVMLLKGADPTWAEAKRQLTEYEENPEADANFIRQLVNFDRDNISDKVLRKIDNIVKQQDFQPDEVGRVSVAAKSLALWVIAMDKYGHVYRRIEPKRRKADDARRALALKQAKLKEAEDNLKQVTDKLEALKAEYNNSVAEKDQLKKRADDTEVKLDRAAKLVAGLAGEKERWKTNNKLVEASVANLPGDCLLAAACLAYLGPCLTQYRNYMVADCWEPQLSRHHIPYNSGQQFSLVSFLTSATTLRTWSLQGLPRDDYSQQNGVITDWTLHSDHWPLLIDPQGQATHWISNLENDSVKLAALY